MDGTLQIDVADKDILEKFLLKRKEWLNLFDGDEHHSVTSQIRQMILDYSAFYLFFEASNLSIAHRLDSATRNFFLFQSFTRQFTVLQSLHIRKLTEKPWPDPKRQIISLRRIVEDIRDNLSLFTRENFVCHDGAPFDTGSAFNAWSEQNPPGAEATIQPSTGRTAYFVSRRKHEDFDRLAEIAFSVRKREDRLPTAVLDRILERIHPSRFKNVLDYSNKFAAHAADETSRRSTGKRIFGFSMNDILEIHREICQIANFISVYFISGTYHEFMPVVQVDPLDQLSNPWINNSRLNELRERWKSFSADVRKYGHFEMDEFVVTTR